MNSAVPCEMTTFDCRSTSRKIEDLSAYNVSREEEIPNFLSSTQVKISSELFGPETDSVYKFQLHVHPKGGEQKEDVMIALKFGSERNEEILLNNVQWKVSIIDVEKNEQMIKCKMGICFSICLSIYLNKLTAF